MEHLNISSIKAGSPCLSPAFCASIAEAAGLSLEEHGHSQGIKLVVVGAYDASYSLVWENIDDRAKSTWNDDEVRTEHAVYCLAFLLMRELTDYEVIERSKKGTGFDYWLGHKKPNEYRELEDELPFQRKARLKVSGIRNCNNKDLSKRVRGKIKQTKRSEGMGLPGYGVCCRVGI